MLALMPIALDTLSMENGVEKPPVVTGGPDLETASAVGRISLHVGVCCSAYEVSETFSEPAKELMRLLAQDGHAVVWGGSDVGLMRDIASAAQDEGATIIGVTEDAMQKYARKGVEMKVVDTIAERKEELLARSDAIVVLVGGTGTFDEITEMVERKKHHHHDKPIVVLNTDNFYEGYRLQMQRMSDEKLLRYPIEKFVYFADTPEEAINHIRASIDTSEGAK